MKLKKMTLLLASTVVASLGCLAQENNSPRISVAPDKVLIAYYSWSGNTRYAAEVIQKDTGGVLFEIKPKIAYPTTYKECLAKAQKECREGLTPELVAMPDDLKKYEVIFVGSPNWYGTMAPPVRTFLSSPELNGKTIVPFFTHGSGGMQNCERDVNRVCTHAKVLPAAAFTGSSIKQSDAALQQFVRDRIELKK
ncbi:MAG: flavodoxin [Victivallales bacterium]|nr:flavodoxin [Victivallales bacterium]